MIERTFLDTNVLVYADDADAGEKRDQAQQVLRTLIHAGAAVVSTQVLQEYFVVVTRKTGLSVLAARRRVQFYAGLEVVPVDTDFIVEAIDLVERHQVSFWDALILRAANAAGCKRILTEDLNDGQVIDGVRIENPFDK